MKPVIVQVYKSTKKEGAYLYLKKGEPTSSIPEVLASQLGALQSAMVLMLTEDKKLAKADGKEVIKAIEDQGFYLQYSPEEKDEYMQKIPNSKLM